jgi:hypothetical protein
MDWVVEELRFDSQQGQDIFRFFTSSGPALVPTHPSMGTGVGKEAEA